MPSSPSAFRTALLPAKRCHSAYLALFPPPAPATCTETSLQSSLVALPATAAASQPSASPASPPAPWVSPIQNPATSRLSPSASHFPASNPDAPRRSGALYRAPRPPLARSLAPAPRSEEH